MNLPRGNKLLCEREVALAPGQSLPRGSSLSRVHVNRPLENITVKYASLVNRIKRFRIFFCFCFIVHYVHLWDYAVAEMFMAIEAVFKDTETLHFISHTY